MIFINRTKLKQSGHFNFIPLVETSKKRYILTIYVILKCECGCEVRPGKKHTCVRSACEAKSEVRKRVRVGQNWSHLKL